MKAAISNTRKHIAGLSAAALLAFGASGVSQAAVIMGTDLIFTYDDSTAFGTANVVGNTIFFNPTTFKAQSENFEGSVSDDATVNITVEVKAGSDFVISGADLSENGDYLLEGDDTSVSLGGQLRATSLTQGPYQIFDFIDPNSPLTQRDQLTAWNADAAIDFNDVAGWGTDTKVILTIENLLNAKSNEQNGNAFIQKKFGGVGLTVMPEVPLPAAAWLFGSALLGLVGVGRRSRS